MTANNSLRSPLTDQNSQDAFGAWRAYPQSNTILKSAAYNAAPPFPEFTPFEGTNISIVIDMTAITTTGGIVFNVEGFDIASGKWVLLLASASVATISTVVLRIGPAMAATTNVAANSNLFEVMRIRPVYTTTTAASYSIGAHLSN